jgi:phosphate transport system substrate-binding protein
VRAAFACTVLVPLLLGGRQEAAASSAAITLTGSGSTFDAPFFQRAFSAYPARNGARVAYRPTGSGAGILDFIDNKVDFGASDVPMNQIELTLAASTGSAVVQIPIALGGVAIAYNDPNIAGTSTLKLDGPTLAAIFLGTIVRWNDPRVTKLNPSIHLPPDRILPVHRADSSGTTYIFTNYLSAVSRDWSRAMGTGKSVAWRGGFRGLGSSGVVTWMRGHAGSIGYVELTYAVARHMPYARLRNRAGAFVAPTPASISAAAAQFPHFSAQHFSIVNASGARSYPIVGYSWVLLRGHMSNKARSAALVKLFRWLIATGQQFAAKLNYAPLPAVARKRAIAGVSTVRGARP